MKLKEFAEGIAADTGMKPAEVRAALAKILAAMHARLSAGEGLELPPLGKIRVVEQKKKSGETKTVYRLALRDRGRAEKQPEKTKKAD